MKNTTPKPTSRRLCALAVLLLAAGTSSFAPASLLAPRAFSGGIIFSAATDDEIASMRAGAIKKELESYGVSTVGLLEKSELVEALQKARANGPPPASETVPATPKDDTKKKKKRRAAAEESIDDNEDDSLDREAKVQAQVEELKSMRVSQLQQELKSRGVSTVGLLEKSELVQALAEAKADGVTASGSGGSSGGDSYAEYSNVEVITDDSAGPRPKQSEGSKSSGGASASPFGNLEDIMGGMGGGMPGGMGGMADILKNMGGMGGGAPAGASPFGGGGNPFGGGMPGGMGGMGDMMGKAQEMMKNPKVMELMMKAQKNPKVMAAMQECMSNPAAINKYRDDPEVAELIRELEKIM